MPTSFLMMENIDKSFPGARVLKNVSFEVRPGEVHALLGENGAGKSTLMKILGGIHQPDAGKITFDGKVIPRMDTEIATQLGVGFVHQELNLSEEISVAENVYLGRLPAASFGRVDFPKLWADTDKVLKELGALFTPKTVVATLTTANKQLVEIARAISQDARVIIFDEPTTSLSDKDVGNLFRIINQLKAKGVAIIYISHRMKEIFEICDRATILRDGEYVGTVTLSDTDIDGIIKMMVGRELKQLFPKDRVPVGATVLEVKNLSGGFIRPASFYLKQGEILGFAGLVGSGRTELMRLLFGADRASTGDIKVDIRIGGKPVEIRSPTEAIENGLCLLTEDRKKQGLCLNLSIVENIHFANMKDAILQPRKMFETAQNLSARLRTKTSNLNNPASSLSGGNQQKVVLSKWLNTDSHIFIFDEPTKGIDVGAKAEIYALMNELVKQGMSIIMISSEMPELLGMADRLYVMCEGSITGELQKDEFNPETIMKLATMGGAFVA